MKIIWRKKERRMEPKNEVHAKIRAGPRGRGQRQNLEQLVQATSKETRPDGL